jgi:hypothetical protein
MLMPEKIYVGIDFSLNSPAFCVYSNSKFSWFSLTRTEKKFESFTKSKDKPFYILSELEDFTICFLEKRILPEEYSEKERVKIDYYLELVEFFWQKIASHIVPQQTVIAIEGLSFASNGNALIDISMATALLRERIVQKIGSQNFYVFSPTSVKKFAAKGNSKKDELYDALIKYEMPETNFEIFSTTLQEHRPNWITPSKSVNKPIDDLVDATWICLKLMQQSTS